MQLMGSFGGIWELSNGGILAPLGLEGNLAFLAKKPEELVHGTVGGTGRTGIGAILTPCLGLGGILWDKSPFLKDNHNFLALSFSALPFQPGFWDILGYFGMFSDIFGYFRIFWDYWGYFGIKPRFWKDNHHFWYCSPLPSHSRGSQLGLGSNFPTPTGNGMGILDLPTSKPDFYLPKFRLCRGNRGFFRTDGILFLWESFSLSFPEHFPTHSTNPQIRIPELNFSIFFLISHFSTHPQDWNMQGNDVRIASNVPISFLPFPALCTFPCSVLFDFLGMSRSLLAAGSAQGNLNPEIPIFFFLDLDHPLLQP